MRIVKYFPIKDEKTKLVSSIFDETIKRFSYPWRFNVMEFHLRDENKAVVDGDRCIIVINYNDFFVQSLDRQCIMAIIIRLFFKLIVKESFGKIPEPIEDIIANRQMIRNGYGDILMSYYFQKKLGKRKGNLIEDDIGWLSFYGIDEYNSAFLRKGSQQNKETKKLLKCLQGNLEDMNVLAHAIREYNEAVKKCKQ